MLEAALPDSDSLRLLGYLKQNPSPASTQLNARGRLVEPIGAIQPAKTWQLCMKSCRIKVGKAMLLVGAVVSVSSGFSQEALGGFWPWYSGLRLAEC
jgi:hypothetical protein